MFRFRLAYKIFGVFILLLVAFAFLPSKGNGEFTPIYAGANSQTDAAHPVITFNASAAVSSLTEAFAEADLAYYPQDRVQVVPDLANHLGGIVTVTRAMPVTIVDGKKSYQARTWATTVKGLLAEQNVTLGDQDKITPALEAVLTANATLTITRVARTTLSVNETITFQVIKKDDPTTYRGEQKVAQKGEDGQRKIDHVIIREDGELVSDTIVASVVTKPVVNEIISVGTKLKLGSATTGKATFYENNFGTKVATDLYKKGTKLLVTNQNNGKKIEVTNDGCICGATGVLIDLSPAYFQQLGGTLGQGVLQNIKVEEVFN